MSVLVCVYRFYKLKKEKNMATVRHRYNEVKCENNKYHKCQKEIMIKDERYYLFLFLFLVK
jgi:hypothetical protein